jgi:hypothetical protein
MITPGNCAERIVHNCIHSYGLRSRTPKPMDPTTIDGPLSRDLDVLRCPGYGGEFHLGDETPITNVAVSLRCDR